MTEEPGFWLWVRLGLRNIRFLVAVSLVAGVVTLAVAFMIPRWYEAQASILPPHERSMLPSNFSNLEAVLQLEALEPYSQVAVADVYLGILKSDTVARSLIDQFDLKERYRQSTLVRTMGALQDHTKIVAKLSGIIVIDVEDKSPEIAAGLANAYVDELDRIYRETRSSAGRRHRQFLETRVLEAEAELDSAEAALTRVQSNRGLMVMSRDLSEVAAAAGGLLGRRMALSVQLDMLDEMGVGNSPARRELEIHLAAVEAEAARLPILGLEVAQRLRDLRIREIFFEELMRQLEAARIEEARNTTAVEKLDVAIPPDRHIRPRKGLMSMAGSLLGFGLGFLWVAYRSREQ